MHSRTLMEWVLRIMANLLRPDEIGPAEAAYKVVERDRGRSRPVGRDARLEVSLRRPVPRGVPRETSARSNRRR